MGGGFEPYSAPSADVYEIFAERGFAGTAIYDDPEFDWDEDDDEFA